MSNISRTSIIRGPGTVKLGQTALFDADGIDCSIERSTKEIPSSVSGTIDTIKTDMIGKVSFTPVGQITSTLLETFYPHQTPTIGGSVFGSSDVALAINSVSGTKVSFVNAALTKIPSLRLSPVNTLFGQAEFTALLGLGKAPGDSGAFYSVGTETYASGAPSPTGIAGATYTATFGGSSGTAIDDTADGWTVDFDLRISPVASDALGTIDYTIDSIGVTAKCKPLGLSESSLLSLLGLTSARGSSIAGNGDLVITGSNGLTVTLKNASVVTGPLRWGTSDLRVGEVAFVANRSIAANGTPGALYGVSLTSSGD